MKTKIYIAGPMSNTTATYNYEKFFYYEELFRKKGFDVSNPASITLTKMFSGWLYDPEEYDDMIMEGLLLLKGCTHIYMIEGWENSKGAVAEHALATALSIDVITGCPEGYHV